MRLLLIKIFFFSMLWMITAHCMKNDNGLSDNPSRSAPKRLLHIHKKTNARSQETKVKEPLAALGLENAGFFLANPVYGEAISSCCMFCALAALGLCCYCTYHFY